MASAIDPTSANAEQKDLSDGDKITGEQTQNKAEELKQDTEVKNGFDEPKSSNEELKDDEMEDRKEKATDDCAEGSKHQEDANQLERKIIRQVEFYFGDRNLMKDRFLQEKIKEDPEGWVTFDVLLTFNRLKTLSTDPSFISQSLRKSNSGLLEVSDDGKCVRRKGTTSDSLPSIGLLSPDVRKEIRGRSLHLKGFPEETSFDDIQEFLLQFGETVLIQMRRYTPEHEKARQFKGSVFVEFKDVSSVTKVVESSGLKFGDNELFVETKEQYLKRQNLKRKGSHSKETADSEEPQSKITKTDEDGDTEDCIRQKDAILHFKGCGADTSREKLKELFNQWSEVGWIDFNIGDTEGFVRFSEEGGAKKVYEAMTKDGEPKLFDTDTAIRVLEGDEEMEYWKKMKIDQMKRKKGRRNAGGGNRRGGFKGKKQRMGSDD